MSSKSDVRKLYVRSGPKSRLALKRIMVELQARHPELTQEQFVTGSWLWMATLGVDAVEAAVMSHAQTSRDEVENILRADGPTADPPAPVPAPSSKPTFGFPASRPPAAARTVNKRKGG